MSRRSSKPDPLSKLADSMLGALKDIATSLDPPRKRGEEGYEIDLLDVDHARCKALDGCGGIVLSSGPAKWAEHADERPALVIITPASSRSKSKDESRWGWNDIDDDTWHQVRLQVFSSINGRLDWVTRYDRDGEVKVHRTMLDGTSRESVESSTGTTRRHRADSRARTGRSADTRSSSRNTVSVKISTGESLLARYRFTQHLPGLMRDLVRCGRLPSIYHLDFEYDTTRADGGSARGRAGGCQLTVVDFGDELSKMGGLSSVVEGGGKGKGRGASLMMRNFDITSDRQATILSARAREDEGRRR